MRLKVVFDFQESKWVVYKSVVSLIGGYSDKFSLVIRVPIFVFMTLLGPIG